MVNNRNILIASLLLLSLGAMPAYADGAGTVLRAGADVNTRNKYGDTPLMEAARFNSPEIIERLLKAGANAKAKNNEEKTAIDYAKENENIYKTKAYWKLNDALDE